MWAQLITTRLRAGRESDRGGSGMRYGTLNSPALVPANSFGESAVAADRRALVGEDRAVNDELKCDRARSLAG